MPTREEIDELKRQWTNDPCWDIEETEGFEEHYNELLAFSEETKRQWKEEQQTRIQQRATKLGIEEYPTLAEYIMELESKLDTINERLDDLLNSIIEERNEQRTLHKQVQRIDYRTQEP